MGNDSRYDPEQALGEGPGPGTTSMGIWGRVSGGGVVGDIGGGGSGAAAGGGGGQQHLMAHEIAERSGIQKLYLSILQHLSSNGLAGVLSSPANGSHLDTILQSVLACLSGNDDASTKKTCLYIFSLLLGGLNRGRSGGRATETPVSPESAASPTADGSSVGAAGGKAARAAAVQRRFVSGKGGGLWTGTGPTFDIEAAARAGVTAFVLEKAVPAALMCLVDRGPAGLDLRDPTAVSATVHMGALLMEGKLASGGSAGFVCVAALACNCTPQVMHVYFFLSVLFRVSERLCVIA